MWLLTRSHLCFFFGVVKTQICTLINHPVLSSESYEILNIEIMQTYLFHWKQDFSSPVLHDFKLSGEWIPILAALHLQKEQVLQFFPWWVKNLCFTILYQTDSAGTNFNNRNKIKKSSLKETVISVHSNDSILNSKLTLYKGLWLSKKCFGQQKINKNVILTLLF